MRRSLYGWSLLLPLFLGCAGKNIVAGEEKTKAEQLESALPSWCQSTCSRLLACPAVPCVCEGDVCNCVGVDSGCEKQCPQAFAPYLDAGEGCATVGQRVKDCLDAMECTELGGPDPCPVTEAERALCPALDDDSNNVPPDNNGPIAGPTVTAGTANGGIGGTTSIGGSSAGGAYGTAGTSAGMDPVSCQGSYGTGGSASANGGSQVTCEEGRMGCADGHDYSWICARDSQGQRACSCLVDGHTKGGFEPVMDCPDLSAVNTGCGWALLP